VTNVVPLLIPESEKELDLQFQLINKRLELVDLRLTRIENLALEIKQMLAVGPYYDS